MRVRGIYNHQQTIKGVVGIRCHRRKRRGSCLVPSDAYRSKIETSDDGMRSSMSPKAFWLYLYNERREDACREMFPCGVTLCRVSLRDVLHRASRRRQDPDRS